MDGFKQLRLLAFIGVWITALSGCSREQPLPAEVTPTLSVPIEMTVGQRTTTPVTGSEGRLDLTVGDVTGGQVMVSLAGEALVLPQRSFRPNDTAEFSFAETRYTIRLTEMANALIGEDRATFRIGPAVASRLGERDKIERLIEGIAVLENAVFVRNGTEHDAEQAAEHLQHKWNHAGGRIDTADAFIEELASRSSMTGRAYQIRFADGSTVSSGDYLGQRLAELESQNPAMAEP